MQRRQQRRVAQPQVRKLGSTCLRGSESVADPVAGAGDRGEGDAGPKASARSARAASPGGEATPSLSAEKASLQELGLELARLPKLERLASQRCAEVRVLANRLIAPLVLTLSPGTAHPRRLSSQVKKLRAEVARLRSSASRAQVAEQRAKEHEEAGHQLEGELHESRQVRAVACVAAAGSSC